MNNDKKIYICRHCGKIVGLIEDGGGNLSCCGTDMELLTVNTVDASKEKHIPACSRDGNNLKVAIGSVPHPMTEEHHISWIMVVQGNKTQRVALDKTGKPEAEFTLSDGSATVYEYCNLHGLWATEI